MSLNRDFVEFLKCLNDKRVRYLLVGGHALAFHGLPRFTKDIDFWVERSQDNAERMIKVLDAFGFGGLGINQEDFTMRGRIVQLGQPPRRIDILTSIDGVEFTPAFERRVISEYKKNTLFVIHKDDLIKNKRASGRPQDLLDLDNLQH